MDSTKARLLKHDFPVHGNGTRQADFSRGRLYGLLSWRFQMWRYTVSACPKVQHEQPSQEPHIEVESAVHCRQDPGGAVALLQPKKVHSERSLILKGQTRTPKPKNHVHSTEEFILNNSRALPNKTRVLRQIAPESSPKSLAKSLSNKFFSVPDIL